MATSFLELTEKINGSIAHSRLQAAPSFGENVWLKREDELPGLTGNKHRKLVPIERLLDGTLDTGDLPGPFKHKPNPAYIHTWSSPDSNFLLELLLKTSSLPGLKEFEVYLTHPLKTYGLSVWLQFLAKSDLVKLVEPPIELKDYKRRRNWAEGKSRQRQKETGGFRFALGGPGLLPLLGALTAGMDLQAQIKSTNCEHIISDAGTGLSAAGLFHSLQLLGENCQLSIVVLTEIEEVRHMFKASGRMLQFFFPYYKPNYGSVNFVKPLTGVSFGSLNKTMTAKWQDLALALGFLPDPVYTLKTLATAESLIKQGNNSQPTIIFCNGGAFGSGLYTDYLRTNYIKS